MGAVIIGGGPAGLMAADVLSTAGVSVDLYDAMPSVGRKFLMAGKGGLNLTHAEPYDVFLSRYGARRAYLEKWRAECTPADVREWAQSLGVSTFVGSSGRVFPHEMKAAPLLRAWLRRLRTASVRLHMRHRWTAWERMQDTTRLWFETPEGSRSIDAGVVVLALGGASWPQLGSDGAWTSILATPGIDIAPLQPSNSGFEVPWSTYFRERFAGEPVKSVVASVASPDGHITSRQGEFVVTQTGIEGGLIYALSAPLREALVAGQATLHLDLAPGKTLAQLEQDLSRPRGRKSFTTTLRAQANLHGVKAALLREVMAPEMLQRPEDLAAAIKQLPLRFTAMRPIAEAISTTGGVRFEALDDHLMLRATPGIFCAGEMLDWDAPTGGYLLTACLASGKAAGVGAARWLRGLRS
jgi:uncharacterized flavoprotein (TIGR03862 family)